MKPYKTIKLEEYPDVIDIQKDARKSSIGKFPGKSGDFHPYCHRNRKKTRRALKRRDKARLDKIDKNDI